MKKEGAVQAEKNSGKKAFALIEVLVTLFILTISILSINYVQLVNHKIAVNLQARASATNMGQRVLDSLEVVGLSAVRGTTLVVTQDNRDFTIQYTTEDLSLETMDSLQSEPVTTALKILVRVTWDLNGTPHSIDLKGVVD